MKKVFLIILFSSLIFSCVQNEKKSFNSISEIDNLIRHKSKSEVLAILGKPNQDLTVYNTWVYFDMFKNQSSNTVCNVHIRFYENIASDAAYTNCN